MARFLDVVFFIYFLTHIPIALFVDFQALFSKHYPQQLFDFRVWYCEKFQDNMMFQPPVWFQSFIVCELFLQLPFFFVACYGYIKGANKCKWLRIPVMIYGTHVATTLIPIISHALFYDFSQEKLGPRNLQERLTLIGIYLPYFIIPVALVLDTLFSSAYTQNIGGNRGGKSKKVKAN